MLVFFRGFGLQKPQAVHPCMNLREAYALREVTYLGL